MASITIRTLDDDLKRHLRMRAAQNGRSMEQEAREILRAALSGDDAPSGGLAQRIHQRFAEIGGVDLTLPDREPRIARFYPEWIGC